MNINTIPYFVFKNIALSHFQEKRNPLKSGDWSSCLGRYAIVSRFSFVYDFHSKKLPLTSKLLTQSSLGYTLSFRPNFVKYRFKNLFPKESLTRSSMVF